LFFTRQALVYWALLMQPLFITLETALVAQLDHSGDHWGQHFSLPLPRWSIYAAKLLVCLLLTALSTGALLFYSILFGVLLRQIHPGLGFDQPIPLISLIKPFLLVFASSGLLISIHTYIAHYWRSFVSAACFGIFMTTGSALVSKSDLAGVYPWTQSAVLVNNFADGLPYLHLLGAGCLAALITALIGGFLFTRRDVL
jgi:ABC-2 type transport system permease protein